ncbi:MAG TPA: 3-hydroxybutyryl-CoA dehydrogenase [Thermoanaerobaculia bacterium]|nr:3-hydroxybutyryl-CoA dehydrogenase [Thermoanaerobaculia bacterium]
MKINRVGVLGAGLMGSGIAEVCAKAGYETILREVSDELARKGVGRVESSLAKAVERGKLVAADRDAARGLLTATTRVQDLEKCDLVIEAVVENLAAKKELFGELDRICGDSAIFCSNTSSLTITELAAATQRPDRFAGLHFFNPVPVMKLVEVVRTIATSDETVATVSEFAQSLGKQPIFAKDNSGFIVNRLLVPYLLDAVRAVEEGVGSPEDVDKGMELGCGHPMGPLKLLDFVGLDTTYAIAEIMFAEYREKRFAPPPLLKRMVLAGRYGRKSGRGFYEYGS